MTASFYVALAINAVLLAVLLVLTLGGGGHDDGGRGMALVFSIIIPALIVAIGAVLFLTSKAPTARVVGLIIVAGPGLLVAGARLRSAVIDYRVRQNASGAGYFSNADVGQAAAAVVRGDVSSLRAIGRQVDVNAKGSGGMTLLELAVEQADQAQDASGNGVSTTVTLDVIRELLARGADPNAGLATATKLKDGTILRALLEGGAKPGYSSEHGPVVFDWLNVMPVAHLTALLDRGLDPNTADQSGVPLVVAAGQNDRWECVLLLMDRGADPERADRQGRKLAEVVQSRVESTSTRPPAMMADIERVKARIAK